MWAQAEVADQVRKLTYGGRALDPLVEQCVDIIEPKTIALCLLQLPDDEHLNGLRRSLRDMFVVQAASGAPKELFPAILKEHFGEHLNEKLHSQMCLAHHHVFVGKFAKSAHPRPPRQRNISLLLRTVGAGCASLAVERNASLRDCQQELCKLFKKAFPKYKASLVFTGSRVYDDFMDRPFRRCAPTDEAVVVFTETDDPYFYDVFDRRGKMPLAGGDEGLPLLHI